MAKITRIKASDEKPKQKTKKVEPAKEVKKPVKAEKLAKAEKTKEPAKTEKKPFVPIRPFVYLGRYLRDSWRELRQVRWPSRKATWKMVLAVLVYTALIMALIALLDLFFTWLFSLIIK